MKSAVTVIAAMVLAGMMAGCKNQATAVSDSDYLLKRQHEYWAKARQSVEAGKVDYGSINNLANMLINRTPRRVEMDYAGPNKAQVLEKLKAIRDEFQSTVLAKTETTERGLKAGNGFTDKDVGDAFMKIDPAYRQFEAMTNGK